MPCLTPILKGYIDEVKDSAAMILEEAQRLEDLALDQYDFQGQEQQDQMAASRARLKKLNQLHAHYANRLMPPVGM